MVPRCLVWAVAYRTARPTVAPPAACVKPASRRSAVAFGQA